VVHILGGFPAVFGLVDSRNVTSEVADDLEGDSDGSCIVKSLSEFNLVTLADVVASEANISHCDVGPKNARSVLGSVGVGHVRLDSSSVSDILEGMGGKTTLASIVIKITSTVHQLLLRESHILSLTKNVPEGF
jgi:hypothetical protein